MAEDMAEDVGERGLVRTTLRNCSCNDDEQVEEGASQGDGENDGCDNHVDLPKITSESGSEEQKPSLQHQGQQLHHAIKKPDNHPV